MLLAFIILLPALVKSQQIVHFSYDISGNRIFRDVIRLGSSDNLNINSGNERQLGNKSADIQNIVKNIEDTRITIKPNPTKGKLKIIISSAEKDEKVTLSVYSSAGDLLLNNNIQSSETDLDLSNYRNGIYFLNISINGSKSGWTIIKQ